MGVKKRKLDFLGLLVAVAVCIASCGTSGNDPSADKATESPAKSNPEETDSAGGGETTDGPGLGEESEDAMTAEAREGKEAEKIDYEAEIRNHYVIKKEYEEMIRALLLENLESVQYIELVEDEGNANYRKIITDAIVRDGVEGVVLSGLVMGVVDGVCEQKSINGILEEAKNGLIDNVQYTAKSKTMKAMDRALTGNENLKLVETAVWMDKFLNVDDTPVGLLNGMVELQRADVENISAILMQEEFYDGDLLYLSALYKRACSRQNEMILAGGDVEKLEQEATLDELIGKWNYENSMLLVLDAMREDSGCERSSECTQNVYHIRDFNLQGLQACYDVGGYKLQEKYTEQAGLVSKKLFGNLLGAMADDSLNMSQESIQQEKIKFYGQLEASLTDSYLEVCRAKNHFDILYGAEFGEITGAQDNMSAAGDDEIYEAASILLEAVSRYAFDLKTAVLFWENTLSDDETDYVNTLKFQLEQCYALLNEGAGIGILPAGYSVEEQCERYTSMMDTYMDYLNWSMIYCMHEPVFSGSSTVTAYGVGDFIVYYRGMDSNPFIFAEKRLRSNYQGARYLWIYDKSGNPIYIRDGHATVYVLDNVVIKAESPSGEDMTEDNAALQLYNNAVRIRSDFLNGNLEHGYENYVF